MKYLSSAAATVGVCATVAMLAACSAGGSQSPPAVSAQLQQGAGRSVSTALVLARLPIGRAGKSIHPDRRRSWMSPDAKKKNMLLYISDEVTNDAYVYAYRGDGQVGKLVGTLSGFNVPAGECVDKAGDVFVTNTQSQTVTEYAHGGTTSIATLNDLPGEYPFACSIDPTTGNLAVTNLFSVYGAGSIAIFANAEGTPTIYSGAAFQGMYYAAYDNAGNLFFDATSSGSGNFQFGELPQGGTSLETVTLNQSIGFPGGVAWDGKYVVVGDQNAPAVYQFTVSGGAGTEAGATQLTGGSGIVQFATPQKRAGAKNSQAAVVIGPSCTANVTQVWAYPAGGTASKTLAGSGCPVAAVVSKGVR
ncbi:MAG TPA: hypothetical protein VGI19_07465 [Candidatus Cybelea sp.]|jgi:hypothetical protein